MGCTFCATGTLRLKRSLTAGEVVAQVYAAKRYVKSINLSAREDETKSVQSEKRTLTHIVFMGMGEPLHTYEHTRDALSILLDQRGASFAGRHITVSTVGLVPSMRRFSNDFKGRIQLALSLHAGTAHTRTMSPRRMYK